MDEQSVEDGAYALTLERVVGRQSMGVEDRRVEDVARRWEGEEYIVVTTMVAQHRTHLGVKSKLKLRLRLRPGG